MLIFIRKNYMASLADFYSEKIKMASHADIFSEKSLWPSILIFIRNN